MPHSTWAVILFSHTTRVSYQVYTCQSPCCCSIQAHAVTFGASNINSSRLPGLLAADVGCWMRRRFSFALAGYLLAFLLTFAALSSAHVVREGLKSQTVSGFRLLVQVPRRLVRRIQATVVSREARRLLSCLSYSSISRYWFF